MHNHEGFIVGNLSRPLKFKSYIKIYTGKLFKFRLLLHLIKNYPTSSPCLRACQDFLVWEQGFPVHLTYYIFLNKCLTLTLNKLCDRNTYKSCKWVWVQEYSNYSSIVTLDPIIVNKACTLVL